MGRHKRLLKLCLFAILTFGVGIVMSLIIWASNPIPNISPFHSETKNISADYYPKNSIVYGISIDSSEQIYLHCYNYTMCFDEEGNYKHSLIYFTTFSNHDGVQFRLREDGNIELKSKGQTESYVCDPEGNIISIYSSGEFESTENQKEIESFPADDTRYVILCILAKLYPLMGNVFIDNLFCQLFPILWFL